MAASNGRRRPAHIALCLAVLAALSSACASTGAVPRPFPQPAAASRPPHDPDAPRAGDADTYAIVGTALSLRGSPYKNGGSTPAGFDCSGFTQYVFAQHGIALPREVRDQFHVGVPVEAADLSAGDLLFFATTEPGASHVAILIGSDEFVHAPSSTGVVRVERLGSSYWSQRFLGARRVTQP